MVTTVQREVAPRVSFATFINEQVATNAATASKGDGRHRLFVGQTRTGKTTLARIVNRMKKSVVVFGTKPKDASLDRYVAEGYVRIDHWPPTRRELKQRGPYEQVRLLLWPKVQRYEELFKFRPIFKAAIRELAFESYWTISVDELFYACQRTKLDLADELSEVAYSGASNGTSLHVTIQRPRGVPLLIPSSCHDVYAFRMGIEDDVRDLAGYSAHSSREVADAIKGLNQSREGVGHEFLYLPFVGDATWKVSEVPSNWA